ncbi:RNA polymerase sigma factor [Chromobacterium subtsugae]|uniref:RNA polymerase sigma factor n=1 Tax=Chromobacterium subtsugae TaxID=251747 RepID=UPI000A457C63|nr:sigma-70 family RNA polymerase sigma factor [Chromobacterium subtsugae]
MFLLQDCSVESDQELVRAWRAVQPDLWRRARRLAKNDEHLANDLLSCTALKTLLYMRRQGDKVREVEGFLFLVLNHVFLDHVRSHGREKQRFDAYEEVDSDHLLAIQAPVPGVLEQLLQEQSLKQLQQALEALNEREQQLFEMRFLDEQSYPFIASHFGINEALARKRVQLLRAKLSQLLTRHDDEVSQAPSRARSVHKP